MRIYITTFYRHNIEKVLRQQYNQNIRVYYMYDGMGFDLVDKNNKRIDKDNFYNSLNKIKEKTNFFCSFFDKLLINEEIEFVIIPCSMLPHNLILMNLLKNRYFEYEKVGKVKYRGLLYDNISEEYIEYTL